MSHYIEPRALGPLVNKYRLVIKHRDSSKPRGQRIRDELARALLAIAGGVWDRYHFTAERDDFCQSAVMHLLGRPLAKADPARPLFNYFTTCAIRFGRKLREKALGDRRRFETYAAEVLEARLRPIPRKAT